MRERRVPRLRRRGVQSVRHLHEFYRRSGRPAYREFILRNARSIWENARNEQTEFGMRWTGPFDQPGASQQSSALDTLTAAAAHGTGLRAARESA